MDILIKLLRALRKPLELALAVVIGLLCSALAIGMLTCLDRCASLAWAEQAQVPTAVAVSRLQPALSAVRARELADAIDTAARPHRIDPILIAAIAMRESSLVDEVIRGQRRGPRGEVGIMHIMPRSIALRWAPDGCDQAELACSLATGCAYLAWLRGEGCPGSTWRWVSAYGRRRCPSEAEAREGRATRRARELYVAAGGQVWER